eukprot:Phypoly_transcript_00651.p1 GENE.Phypoly_transcript_00651~~Phypoly_transcript_00651.p1  ORF type:complete len:873 (+),score=93.35 Phypoly_transcript_00651:1602-4220(+)
MDYVGWLLGFACATILFSFVYGDQYFPDYVCKVTSQVQCIEDDGDNRILPFSAYFLTAPFATQEMCVERCSRLNYTIAGVEFGDQCFCGNEYLYTPVVHPMSECQAMPCAGAQNESCGAADRMLILAFNCSGPVAPSGYACLDSYTKSLPFCDTSRTIDERVDDLMARLTLEEKMGLMGCDTVNTPVDDCSCMTNGIERLGIPDYMQIVETNSAVASACVAPFVCATEFAAPANLAASFNRSIWYNKGQVISTEMRAFNNLNWYRASTPYSFIGLLGFGPNINIVRDPRFGRNSELPSEDPFLSGSYASEYLQGMQQATESKFLRMISGLKHYGCYSIEDDRMARNVNVSMFDLWDTYLPQFEMGFSAEYGNAQAVMCSYASVNGVPSCANDYLINQVVRGKWGRPDVLVATDCGAVGNMVNANFYAKNNADAAAKALNGGSDVNLGDMFFPPAANGGNGALVQALQLGLTNETFVNASAKRIITKRFITGQFDPTSMQPYTQIGVEAINSTASNAFNLDAILQGLILLKNQNDTLPFSQGKKLAVVGPHVISQRDLFEDYKGDMECYGGGDGCVRTIGEVFSNFNGPNLTQVQIGVQLDSNDTSGIQAALDAVSWADQVVLCIGLGYSLEHEGIDRPNTLLPGLQESFSLKVLSLGKPTVIVLINGGIVSIDSLVEPAPAIIEAFYPSMRGAEALFMSIFGQANRWGRLPVTIYPASFATQTDMYSFNMTLPPGRTYRYYTGTPLFDFGSGLSYTTFSYNASASNTANSTAIIIDYRNSGKMTGDDVFLVYHRVGDDVMKQVNHPVPFRSLVGFDRVGNVGVGEKGQLQIVIPRTSFYLTNNTGDKVLYYGTHYLDITDSISPLVTLTVII